MAAHNWVPFDFFMDSVIEMKKDSGWVTCGGTRCSHCEKWITLPRKYKNWRPVWEILCEECHEDVLTVTFCPREESLKTEFKVKFEDIPRLIQELIEQWNKLNLKDRIIEIHE